MKNCTAQAMSDESAMPQSTASPKSLCTMMRVVTAMASASDTAQR